MHYGEAALGPTTRLPAYFVFDRAPVDITGVARAVVQHAGIRFLSLLVHPIVQALKDDTPQFLRV